MIPPPFPESLDNAELRFHQCGNAGFDGKLTLEESVQGDSKICQANP
jgi:hypothetical protein